MTQHLKLRPEFRMASYYARKERKAWFGRVHSELSGNDVSLAVACGTFCFFESRSHGMNIDRGLHTDNTFYLIDVECGRGMGHASLAHRTILYLMSVSKFVLHRNLKLVG